MHLWFLNQRKEEEEEEEEEEEKKRKKNEIHSNSVKEIQS